MATNKQKLSETAYYGNSTDQRDVSETVSSLDRNQFSVIGMVVDVGLHIFGFGLSLWFRFLPLQWPWNILEPKQRVHSSSFGYALDYHRATNIFWLGRGYVERGVMDGKRYKSRAAKSAYAESKLLSFFAKGI